MPDVPDAAVIAVLTEMDWPDDREHSAHVEPDGYQLTPPGAYWDTAGDIARAVIAAVEPILRADERATVAEEVAADILTRLAAIGLRPTPWADGYTLASRYAAAVSRKHAAKAPGSHGDGREGALTSDPTPEGANAAETLSGRSGQEDQT